MAFGQPPRLPARLRGTTWARGFPDARVMGCSCPPPTPHPDPAQPQVPQGSPHGYQGSPIPTHEPAHSWRPLMPPMVMDTREPGAGGIQYRYPVERCLDWLGQAPQYLTYRVAGGTPAGSQSPLQSLCPTPAPAPVAQARAETSRLCKGQVPSPLHNDVLALQHRGGRGSPRYQQPSGQGSQGCLGGSKGLPRDFAVISSPGAQIGVGKGVALSPGGTNAAWRCPHWGSASGWVAVETNPFGSPLGTQDVKLSATASWVTAALWPRSKLPTPR